MDDVSLPQDSFSTRQNYIDCAVCEAPLTLRLLLAFNPDSESWQVQVCVTAPLRCVRVLLFLLSSATTTTHLHKPKLPQLYTHREKQTANMAAAPNVATHPDDAQQPPQHQHTSLRYLRLQHDFQTMLKTGLSSVDEEVRGG